MMGCWKYSGTWQRWWLHNTERTTGCWIIFNVRRILASKATISVGRAGLSPAHSSQAGLGLAPRLSDALNTAGVSQWEATWKPHGPDHRCPEVALGTHVALCPPHIHNYITTAFKTMLSSDDTRWTPLPVWGTAVQQHMRHCSTRALKVLKCVVYPDNGILFSTKGKWAIKPWGDVEEP